MVGSDASFDQGREQMQLLAGLEVTRKAVERHAEAIGGDIECREQAEIQRVVQIDLPDVAGDDIPVLYIEMDGTMRDPRPIPAPSKALKHSAAACIAKLAAGLVKSEKESVIADGAVWIWNIAGREFPGAVQIVDTTRANTYGYWPESCSPPSSASENVGPPDYRKNPTRERSNRWSNNCAPFPPLPPTPPNYCGLRRSTSNGIGSACVTQNFAARNSSSVHN